MIAAIVQILGLTVISVGLGFIYIPAGIVAFGASCVLVGLALEKGKF